jgi:Ca2+-dependent lipid-binding protein
MINPSSVFDKKGTISVTCVNARLTHDTELVGKMDPYCVLTYEKTKVKTKVADNQGKTPSWNEKFNIPLGVENKIFLEVYDKDLTKDDLVGTTHL